MKTYSELNRIPTEGEEVKVLLLLTSSVFCWSKYAGALNKKGTIKETLDTQEAFVEINNEEFVFHFSEIGPVNQ